MFELVLLSTTAEKKIMGQQIPEYRYTGIQSSLMNFALALIKEDIALNTIVLRTREDFEKLKRRYKGDLYGAELAIFHVMGVFFIVANSQS